MQKIHSHKMKLPFQGDAVIVSKLGGIFFLLGGRKLLGYYTIKWALCSVT